MKFDINKNWCLVLRVREDTQQAFNKAYDFPLVFIVSVEPETGQTQLCKARANLRMPSGEFPFYTWQMCNYQSDSRHFQYSIVSNQEVSFLSINDEMKALFGIDMRIEAKSRFYSNLGKIWPNNTFVPLLPFVGEMIGRVTSEKSLNFSSEELGQLIEQFIGSSYE